MSASPKGLGSRLSLALVVLSMLLVAALWTRLPDPMPSHWNIEGKVDGYMPKPWGPLVGPLAMLFLHALMWLLPRLSPRALDAELPRRLLGQIQLSITSFLFVVMASSMLVALGVAVPVNRVLSAALGALVIGLGVAMGELPKNRLVGIRTPWTLANDEVWQRTHALGARLFILAGLLALVGGSMGLHLMPIMIALGTAAVAPVFYSFRLYRKVAGNQPPRAS